MRRGLPTMVGLTAVALVAPWLYHPAAAMRPTPDSSLVKTTTTCQEDQRCWDCATMGNRSCGDQPYPRRITGSRWAGWRIVWSDGSVTTDGGWEDVRRECNHTDYPTNCLTAWNVIDTYRAEEQRMLAR